MEVISSCVNGNERETMREHTILPGKKKNLGVRLNFFSSEEKRGHVTFLKKNFTWKIFLIKQPKTWKICGYQTHPYNHISRLTSPNCYYEHFYKKRKENTIENTIINSTL